MSEKSTAIDWGDLNPQWEYNALTQRTGLRKTLLLCAVALNREIP